MTSRYFRRPDARGLARSLRETSSAPLAKGDTSPGRTPKDRFMLWVDAVGGYLICLDNEVVIGQPSGGAAPTLPILGDISRRHAIVRREGGGYVLDAIGPTLLDGREVTGPHVLGENHLIQLGQSVQLRFVKPHALSASARLTLESPHRTAPSADAVLLMAESCVLGAGRHCHVRCRDWQDDVILFRQEDGLCVRSGGSLSVDGTAVTGTANIIDGSRIEGQDFSMGIELV